MKWDEYKRWRASILTQLDIYHRQAGILRDWLKEDVQRLRGEKLKIDSTSTDELLKAAYTLLNRLHRGGVLFDDEEMEVFKLIQGKVCPH